LAAAELGDDAYSFVFDGQIGTLDYALANDALTDKLAGVTEWHINADEPDAFDYNLDFGRNPDLFDGESPHRNSDHDPVIVSFDFESEPTLIVGTNKKDTLTGTEGADIILGLRARDTINAGAGDDEIDAGLGNDFVDAGAGEDVIYIGEGRRDKIFGGADGDTFVFSATALTDGRLSKSVIFDFDVTEDMIDLGGADITGFREFNYGVRIDLNNGKDKIVLRDVESFEDIMFVEDTLLA